MKKIYFILPSLNFGGGEKVVVNIANNIDLEKFNVKIITLRNGNDLKKSIKKNIEIITFNKSRLILSFFMLFSYLRKDKPDIIFSGAGDISIALGLFKKKSFLKKLKIIGRERGVISNIFETKKKSFKNRVIRYLYKNYLKDIDFLIMQSEKMKKEFLRYTLIKEEKLRIFYNPLDLKMIESRKKEEINKVFYLNKVKLISVGRLEDVKNHLKMIKIFEYLDKEKYVLNIIGDGKNYRKISEKIKELDLEKNVNLVGFTDNPYKYMFNSDVLLITSDVEALPNVVLEGNACGCKVVALDCPGGIHEIIENGRNGYIVNNIQEMAQKIKEIEINESEKIKIKNYAKKYDIKDYINNLEMIL